VPFLTHFTIYFILLILWFELQLLITWLSVAALPKENRYRAAGSFKIHGICRHIWCDRNDNSDWNITVFESLKCI